MDAAIDEAIAKKLAGYRPSPATVQLVKSTPILLLVGPTGAGKDALKDKLLATGHYHHIVSHTTRLPRINHGVPEQDGLEYHFIDKQTAEKMLDEQAMIEAKLYSGNLYGTSAAEIQQAHDQGKIAMTDIEVQGVAEYKALDPAVMAIFILPPDFETWQRRLQGRYGEALDPADYRLRLQTALNELEQLLHTDYYVPIINDHLDHTFEEVQAITNGQTLGPAELQRAHTVAQKLAADIQTHLAQDAKS